MTGARYEKFDLKEMAVKGLQYITSMVDDAHDFLPYWFLSINTAPAFARHVRVDDAELVASWYEAIVALQKIVGPSERAQAVEAGFKRHLLRHWGPAGLRYHGDYPWSNTNHASFHEMGWVLAGLNRLCLEEPDNGEAQERARGLVAGLRKLVVERKIRTFWSGDYPINEKVYEFPGDLYLRDGGFVPERCTGRGEESIRNAVLLEPLVTRAIRFDDAVALDLAEGIANHMLGLSRYFNWRGEFFGHVHSAVWFAIGLLKLGRHRNNAFYTQKAMAIYEYVASISSRFGWVPEYAQWFAPGEVHCETCCIKDMIEFSIVAAEDGADLWERIDLYTRNQLCEQQIRDGSFIAVDRDRADDAQTGYTWKDMDRRVVGGWSGGAEPNSISLSRFRSIAGCCVGTAPVGLWLVWRKIVEKKADGTFIQLPMERDHAAAKVSIGYPNEGFIRVEVKQADHFFIRAYPWMGDRLEALVDNVARPVLYTDGCVSFPDARPGQTLTLRHRLTERHSRETVSALDLRLTWRGPDVVRMSPEGPPLQIYQRVEGAPKNIPAPPAVGETSRHTNLAPTDQKKK
jgi:hypothetical protein